MSSSEIEVRQEAAPARVVPPKPKTDDWALVIMPITGLAEQVAGTEFVPAALRGKPAAVAAAILFGRELDMPPMQALQQVHVIEGRPSLSAEHKRAMVLEQGHQLTVTGDGGSATATGRRLLWRHPQTGEPVYGEPQSVTWTLAMATVAGLTGKKNWQKHPRQMLKARATAELINDMFPDITHGLATLEELGDEDAVPSSAPAPATEKVSRARKRVASAPAVGTGGAETPAPTATTAPESVTIPEVPLPGEEEPAAVHVPGEGLGKAAGPALNAPQCPKISNGEQCKDTAGHKGECLFAGTGRPTPPNPDTWGAGLAAGSYPVEDVHLPVGPGDGCPHMSNGEQCRYVAGHNGPHTFGGGLQDPVSNRHCGEEDGHDPHAWSANGGVMHNCSGAALTEAQRADLEAYDETAVQVIESATLTGTNEQGEPSFMDARFREAQEAAGGPVPENDPPISGGKRRLLLAAFGSLGVKDRAERLHTTSALLGRQVETWDHLTSGDGDKLIRAVNGLKTREELEELVQRAAAEWGQQP